MPRLARCARDRVAGAGRCAAPRGRTKPDRHAQYAPEPSRAAGRHQRDRRPRSASRRKTASSRSARWCVTRKPKARAEIARRAPLIALALPHIGHPAIRNRGTIGGSIAFADPAAELPACLLALGGELDIAGPQGERTVKADDFFKGLFETALTPRDVLTAIRVPAASADTRVGFAEFARRHGDYAMVGLAACARADGRSPRRSAPRLFRGRPDPAARAQRRACAGSTAMSMRRSVRSPTDLDPPDDVQASGAVKTHLAGVLLRRVARQLGRSAVMSERFHDDRRHGQRRGGARTRRRAQDAGRLPARGPGADRQPCRLRAWRVRRLHRARRRRGGARLPDAGRAMRRRAGRHHRGRGRQRRDRRSAAGIHRAQRAAVRLLHARHAAHRAGIAGAPAAFRAARRSACISPATTAAAPATRPSSMRWRRWRRREARPARSS